MDEKREAIRKEQQQTEALENDNGSPEETEKLKRELRSLGTEHTKRPTTNI